MFGDSFSCKNSKDRFVKPWKNSMGHFWKVNFQVRSHNHKDVILIFFFITCTRFNKDIWIILDDRIITCAFYGLILNKLKVKVIVVSLLFAMYMKLLWFSCSIIIVFCCDHLMDFIMVGEDDGLDFEKGLKFPHEMER